jgi:hypothetical protein
LIKITALIAFFSLPAYQRSHIDFPSGGHLFANQSRDQDGEIELAYASLSDGQRARDLASWCNLP